MPSVRFGFKRLDVYRAAVAFWQWALRVATRIPRNRFFVADQFLRAALSVSLNIAESAGNKTPAEALNHCRHASGSTTECAALLDARLAMGVISEKEYDEQEDCLARIAGDAHEAASAPSAERPKSNDLKNCRVRIRIRGTPTGPRAEPCIRRR